MVTSLLCDLMSDASLFVIRNEKRNRRVAAFAFTLLGAVAGGWVTKVTGGIRTVLWITAGIKLAVCVAWVGWRGEGGTLEV